MQRALPADRWLHALLGATIALPALAFAWGTRQGRVVFVLFQEPKLAAIQILGWTLLAALFWRHRADLRSGALLAVLLRPPWRWLALFLAYGTATVLWVTVRENLFYELSQYLLLVLLVLALGVWSDRDPRVPRIVEHALIASLGTAALVGLIQGVFPLAVLSPIDPGSGVTNPSFLGYKNPMALALTGQVFLLVGLILPRGLSRRSGRLLALLLVAELFYLATLKSRTSYVALFGSALCLGILLIVRERFSRRTLRACLAGSLLASLFLLVLAIDPDARSRALSALSLAGDPARYLESDRGTYLVNSINMVRHRPLGVGFGDWQSQYPVYRLVRRDVYFTRAVQVRTAHSDHVQYFAETGWPGFALWVCFWISLLALPVRGYLRSGNPRPLLLAAQVAAFGIAMGTDYVTQHPYLKLEFLLVAYLAAGAAQEPRAPLRLPESRPQLWPAVLVTVLAVAATTYWACGARKTWLGASLTATYLAVQEQKDLSASRKGALVAQAARAGETMAQTPGYHKELSDAYRILAAIELRRGNRTDALASARSSLRLHPYSPNTLWLMARLLRDHPAEASQWSHAANYVMNEATSGFAEPYPVAPD